ncbi:MAG: glycosyltransferase family 2 protein [Propionibacteriaceae bacterium]|nr:glycosyltransferase family 2 protein [Propionibacteriaceae bacterium]
MEILAIIPAHNEAQNIEAVVDELVRVAPEVGYVVVNDGSADDTAAICRRRGYHLIDLPLNLGLAGAVQAGLQYASRRGYDAAVQLDGDGQHDPRCIGVLSQAMAGQGADIVIASRFLEAKKGRGLRMAGSRLLSLLIRLTTGAKITDPTSGMRLFSKAMADEFAWNINYGPEPDTVAYLIRSGAKVVEAPAAMRPRQHGESYLNALRSLAYMLNMCVSIVFIQWFRKREARR